MFKYNHNNLNTYYKDVCRNLRYVCITRNFSSPGRSEEILTDKCIRNKLAVYYEPKVCEVLQLDFDYARSKKAGLLLFEKYKKKINKASKKVQKIFTLNNIIKTYFTLYSLINIARNYKTKLGAITLPIYKNLYDPCFLLISYSELINKKITKGNVVFFENTKLASIFSLSIELKLKFFSTNPSKKIFVTKGSGKTKSFNVVSIKDKIVQKALYIILKPFFENVFMSASPSFRLKRSCHIALKFIYYEWQNITWFIEFDFVQKVCGISHSIILSIFNEYINDYWTSILIYRFLKKSCVNFGNFYDTRLDHKIGLAQKSTFSFFICSILFHKFDCFIENFIYLKYSNFVTKKIVNNKIKKLKNNFLKPILRKLKKKYSCSRSNKIRTVFKTIKKLNKIIKDIRYSSEKKLNIKKIQYIRYIDNSILGTISTKQFAYNILCKISLFLNSFGINLNTKKSSIKHYEKGIFFLGFKIYRNYKLSLKWKTSKSKFLIKDMTLKFAVPLKKLFQYFTDKGFFQKIGKKKKFIGCRQNKWLFLNSDYDIIMRYNSIIKSIRYYYSCSTNKNVLNRFWYTLRKSAALTISHRYKKRSAKWALNKFGSELHVTNCNGDMWTKLKIPTPSKKIEFKNDADLNYILVITKDVYLLNESNLLSLSNKKLDCAIPDCTIKANKWYYVKSRKKVKNNNKRRIDRSNTAKQIPLCPNHYNLVNYGNYSGSSIRKLPGYIPSNFN